MRMVQRKDHDQYEDDIRKISELMKDRNKWEEYMSSIADTVLDNWPGRRSRKAKNSAESSST